MKKSKDRIVVEYMPVESVHPYANNPRINDGAVDYVARSIERYGFRAPICVDKDNVIIYGHTRLRAAIRLGMKEVPVYRATDMSPEQAAEYRLADNSVAEIAVWDRMKLKEEFAALPSFKPADFGFFGFKADPEKIPELEAESQDIVTLDGANPYGSEVALMDDDPYTDNITDLGIPRFDGTKVPTWDDVKDLRLFIGHYTDFPPPYFYIWGTGRTHHMEGVDNIFENGCVAFYTEDDKFNNIYPYPAEVTTKLLNAHVKMCVMPNFSSYPRMPMVERLFQIYKSHFVARYWQKNGLLVIPDFMPQADIWKYTEELIPKGCPFAIQIQQRLEGEELAETANMIRRRIDTCEPPYVLAYYSKKNREALEHSFDGVRVVWVETFCAQCAEHGKGRKRAQATKKDS